MIHPENVKLVGGFFTTPLKNMSSSIGIIIIPKSYGKMPKMATKPPTRSVFYSGNLKIDPYPACNLMTMPSGARKLEAKLEII